MVGRRYVPDRGDLVWIDHDPSVGHERRKRRPAVVLSPRSYNRPSGLALMCPITSTAKGYPIEIPLPSDGLVAGVVLADQVRSLDWTARDAKHIGRVAESVVEMVHDFIIALTGG